MSAIQPVTLARHAQRRWRRFPSYAFAATQSLVPIMGPELARAAVGLTLAFAPDGGGFIPVAVLGVQDNKCLYVGPDGQWLGQYVPAMLRGFPFLLAATQDGKKVFCVDEGSGLVVDDAQGEPFFGPDGHLTEGLKAVLGFLSQTESNRRLTQEACASLHSHRLIQPWDIGLELGEKQHKIEGLFRVDAAALDAIGDEAFLELRHSGALVLAYAQVLSAQNLPTLAALAQARSNSDMAQTAPPNSGELDLAFMQGDTLRFS